MNSSDARPVLAYALLLFALASLLLVTGEACGDSLDDNFELRPAKKVIEEEENYTIPVWMGVDPITSEVHATTQIYSEDSYYYPYDGDRLVVSKFNDTSLSFESYFDIEFMYPEDHAVVNGTPYFLIFNYTSNEVLLRFHNDTHYVLLRDNVTSQNYNLVHTRFVEESGDCLKILLIQSFGNPFPPYSYHFIIELLTYDIDGNSTTKMELLRLNEFVNSAQSTVRDGIVTVMWDLRRNEIWNFSMFTHDLTSSVSRGPMRVYTEYNVSDYSDWSIEMDSSLDVHLFVRDYPCKLMRFSFDGHLEATTELMDRVQTDMAPYMMIINGSDVLYFFCYEAFTYQIVLFLIDNDYGPHSLLYRIRASFRYNSVLCAAVNSTDRVIFGWYQTYYARYRGYFSCQTPLTPDLMVDPASFDMVQREHSLESVDLRYTIRNYGRAASNGYRISLYHTSASGGVEVQLASFETRGHLEPGDGYDHVFSGAVPYGINRIRILVSEVRPLENNWTNNVFKTTILVSVNNPPRLVLEAPRDSATFREELVVSGITTDIDGPSNVSTRIWGISNREWIVPGPGGWNQTIDLSDVASGDYILLVQAFDGTDLSNREFRNLRVDHPLDSMTMDSSHPHGPVVILLGQAGTFMVNVTERFSRPLTYNWSIDGTEVGGNTSLFKFLSKDVGVERLYVHISNGLISLEHAWDITIHPPVAPSLARGAPEDAIRIDKGETVEFSLEVVNPDDQACSLFWMMNDEVIDDRPVPSFNWTFEASGVYHVVAVLLSRYEQGTMDWTIAVVNKPPEVTSSEPSNKTITITVDETISFAVSASDPDGDILSFRWSSPELDLSGLDSGSCEALCPCTGNGSYVVSVSITDGEDTISLEWTIVPLPETIPEDLPDNREPDVMVPLLAILLTVGAVVGIHLWRTRKRSS